MGNGTHRARVARQHKFTEAFHVRRSVRANDVGDAQRAPHLPRRAHWPSRGSLKVNHQAIKRLVQPLDAGLRDVHLKLGRAHRLVAKDVLDRAQRHARFDEVRRVAVPKRVNRGVLLDARIRARGSEGLLERRLVERFSLRDYWEVFTRRYPEFV